MTLTEENKEFIKTHLVDRRGTDNEKWDGQRAEFGTDGLLPMWIADMEFSTPQPIKDALIARVNSGVFGYPLVPKGYYDALANWMQTRHNTEVKAEWVRFDVGVVNALYRMVAWLTKPGEPVVIMQPVYYPFMKAIENQGRVVVSADLVQNDSGWHIDFDALEKAFARPDVHVAILCSPHNPVGRIWTATELAQVLALADKYQVLVISDEIHQDFEIGGPRFTSTLSIDNGRYQGNLIVLNAASKTFNLASLRNAHIIIPDEARRADYDAFATAHNAVAGTLLGQVATQAGYEHGGPWLTQLIQVIRHNYGELQAAFAAGAPDVRLSALEGTYLSFVDLGAYMKPDAIQPFVQDQCRIAVDYGAWFSPKTATCIRMNLATDPKLVLEAADRVITALHQR
ncbi:MalY/PatB family protein [Lacticaseibacillus mingshuiensis]|uniref:MalY/PatB family protein n=1 Tax=Lacticaseibacillus mingshuiensis TaxID=2799574 RepID=UPI001950EB7E|nr:PatB family C-S lyase [Lacticaseibacillus mingshuiensis]